MRLSEIARHLNLAVTEGDDPDIVGVCALGPGQPGRLAFLADPRHRAALADTAAAAVIVAPDVASTCPVPALMADNPQLAFARAAALFVPPPPAAGRHRDARVDDEAQVHPEASVAAGAIVEAGARVEAGAVLGPGCVIAGGAVVGPDCRIGANAVIGAGVVLGARVAVEPGAILGGRGFGLAQDKGRWVPIPQLGGVVVGDDVEIGAGCTIDRGALGDTVIGEGVKLDDQVHVAHNCRIGPHTVIAGCTGIAGSTTIGGHCMIGGGVGIGDHVTVADGVVITGASQVPADIDEPGIYSSTLKAMPASDWRRRLALIRKLDRMEKRLRELERRDDD